MSYFKFFHRSLTAFSLVASTAAIAQVATNPAAPPAAVSATAPSAIAGGEVGSPGTYRSAFDGYQGFSDEKVVGWKEANDTVGKIGGWREYAKQARSEEGKPQTPQAKPGGTQQPAVGGSGAPAAGHGKH
jgi:hypothetical protein